MQQYMADSRWRTDINEDMLCVAMASNLTIGCESVIIFYFHVVKSLRDQTIHNKGKT